MNSSISLDGIKKAIEALRYRNQRTLKYRLVHALIQFYDSQDAVISLEAIDSEQLITLIWGETVDAASKRKNLNSLRSSVNADFMKCFEDGTNSEGIIIDTSNTFVMSDDAKDKYLGSFTQALSAGQALTLDRITELSGLFGEFLTKIPDPNILQFMSTALDVLSSKEEIPTEKIPEILNVFSELLNKIKHKDILNERDKLQGFIEDMSDKTEALDDDDIVEEIVEEVDENDEEIEEVDDSEVVEVVDVMEDEDEEQFEDDEPLDDIDEDELLDLEGDEESIEEAPFDLSEEEILEQERNKRLSERFDRFLGAVEKRYNKYQLVPKGEYIIGSDEPEKDEISQQTIALPDYFVGKFPVTNSLFEIFVEQTGYQTSAEEKGYGIVYQGRYQKKKDEKTGRAHFIWNATHQWKPMEEAYWYQPHGPGSNLHKKRFHPVVQISLKDALAFSAWVGKRLPNEAEWEAAARTKQGHRYPWGDAWKNEMCNTEDTEIADTTPVDQFPDAENDLGLSDLLGNTLDWTSEPCDPPYKTNGHKDYHIVKGGSWISDRSIRLYARFKLPIHFSSNILGFRCLAD